MDSCYHYEANPWMNQAPQWQTTERTFGYDANGQLLKCVESKDQFEKYTYTYEYDTAGNRTKAKKQKAFTFQSPDSASYTYNADNQMVGAVICEGNLTKRYTYQYDTENRLEAVYDRQKLLMAAAYDGDGNRTFQLNYNPEAECGYGKNVNGQVFMPENSTDEEGNLTANTWHNGMVTSVYQYDPYGQMTLGSTDHTDFYGYNGESYNPNTGLEYLRSRYYNANQGRFFQEDTYLGDITDPLTLNRYAYVKNSPSNYTDPSGHDPATYMIDDYYYIEPDDKENNLALNIWGIIPFGDIGMMRLDEIIRDVKSFSNKDAQDMTQEAIGLGITGLQVRVDLLIKAGFVDEAVKLTSKMKFLGWVGTGLSVYSFKETATSDASYVSQITVKLYSKFLYDKDRDTLISRIAKGIIIIHMNMKLCLIV